MLRNKNNYSSISNRAVITNKQMSTSANRFNRGATVMSMYTGVGLTESEFNKRTGPKIYIEGVANAQINVQSGNKPLQDYLKLPGS